MSLELLGAQLAAGLTAFGARSSGSAAPSDGTRLAGSARTASSGSAKDPGSSANTATGGTLPFPGATDGVKPFSGRQMQGAGRTEKGRFDRNECESCKNRTYQDGSNDPGVSFKTPTVISADNAASAVMGHEQEHVTREQAKASAEGREVISQSVTIQNAICPECGRTYVAGGVTRTVTGSRAKPAQPDGTFLNAVA